MSIKGCGIWFVIMRSFWAEKKSQIVLPFWREHSCNKVDTLSLSSLMTFSWQSYNFPRMLLPSCLTILGRSFLQQSWHFVPFLSDDIFMTKLQLSLDVASKHLLGLLSYHFGMDIVATKLTLCAFPLWWHFHDKVTTFLGCCFQAFARSIVLPFWGGHSCNKVDTLCLSSLMTFPWQTYNFS